MENTHSSLLRLWPSFADLAKDIGAKEATVRKWVVRNRIPPAFWPSLVSSAENHKIPGITYERLALIAAARRTREAA